MKRAFELRSILCATTLLLAYFFGALALSNQQGLSWSSAPVFWVKTVSSPFWIKAFSVMTLLAGILLIYFVPGVFIAKFFDRKNKGLFELGLEGFLINYFFYYATSTFYKMFFHQPFLRETMLSVISLGVSATILMFFLFRKRAVCLAKGGEKAIASRDTTFSVFYALFLLIVFFVFYEKILFSHFNGDGAEQYWLAQSLQTQMLPTAYRAPVTLMPQFVFAPTVYLNMFVINLFGHAEFILRIQVWIAFVGLGFALKKIIEEMRGDIKLEVIEYLPLFLYLFLFFSMISYRAGYAPPADLARSNETVQLFFFLAGLYFLIRRENARPLLAAVFFIFAAMIRYNGFIAVTLFLAIFSFLFGRYRCFAWYLAGGFLAVLILQLFLISSPYSIRDMIKDFIADAATTANQAVSMPFLLNYLKNYFVLTGGLSVFLFLNPRNKYNACMLFTSLACLVLPFRSVYVPAHYFVPIIMFPLLSYYLCAGGKKLLAGLVIACELLSLCYVLPSTGFSRGFLFKETWSRICLNTTDLFEANRRLKETRPSLFRMDDRVAMYYADFMPKSNKQYAVYFDSVPTSLASNYDLIIERGIRTYLLKGFSKNYFIEGFIPALRDYQGGEQLFIVSKIKIGEIDVSELKKM